MELVIVGLAVFCTAAVVVLVFSGESRRRLLETRIQLHAALPMPTVEWIARRVLDKVEQQSPSTLRGKVLPPLATVTVNDEVYEVLESLWHSVSHDLSEAIAATAHAEGWECDGVTFGLRASTNLGRRDVEVRLAFPTSDEVSTSHVPRRAQPNGGRRDTEATFLTPHGDAQWFVERSGFAPAPLPRGRDVVIGASAKCDLVVASSVVSRRHLRLHWDSETNLVKIEDLGSTNGSWLESQRLQPHVPMAVTHDSWLRLSKNTRIRLVLRTGVSRLR